MQAFMRSFWLRSIFEKRPSRKAVFFIAALPLVSSAESRRRVGLRPRKLLIARKKKKTGTRGSKCMIVGL